MAFDEKLNDRLREALHLLPNVEEKHMFGGVCYMLNGKMCIGVVGDELMCRINPDMEEEALSKNGARPMDFNGKPMKGYVFVAEPAYKTKKQFDYWLSLCIAFNALAKASKKKKK